MKMLGWFSGPFSKKVLRIIVALTVVLYVAFFLIGYNHPFADNPDFIEPRLTSLLLGFVFLVLFIALAVTAWAVCSSIRKRGTQVKSIERRAASKMVAAVIALTAVIMLVSFWMGPTAAMSVNGKEYADTSGLRMADMFVATSLALMVIAALAVAISSIRSHFSRRR